VLLLIPASLVYGIYSTNKSQKEISEQVETFFEEVINASSIEFFKQPSDL
jgi:DNA gyrase inhibitor GyrI